MPLSPSGQDIDGRRRVKLSCRNIWKVYGPDPGSYFTDSDSPAEAGALARRMRNEAHLPALIDVGFDVHEGEIFMIMGLSGSGKSTLLRCLSRLVEPSHGAISFDGVDLRAATAAELIQLRRHKMGMVFQSFGLMPHLRVLENIAFPLKLQGVSRAAREQRAIEMIRLVGLDGREDAFPHQLSGGQQQRVGIARSLAAEPELWFLDEPFSALDPLIRRQMQDEFLRLQGQLHKTIIFVTHDIMEACRLADRIALLRDGRLVQIGRPADILLNPADDHVAEFTAEVARGRVIRLGDLLTGDAVTETGVEAPLVAADQPLEGVLAQIAAGVPAFRLYAAGRYGSGLVPAARIVDVLGRARAADQSAPAGPRE